MDVKEDFLRAKTVLMMASPFIGSLLNKARVIVTQVIPTAAVDRDNNLLINPEFFGKLKPEEQVFILAHEAMHWAFLDHKRDVGRDQKTWNIVADGVNNNILIEILNPGRLINDMVTLDRISEVVGKPVDELERMTKEQIYNLLPRITISGSGTSGQGKCTGQNTGATGQQNGQQGDGDEKTIEGDGVIGDDLRNDIVGEGEVIQEGSNDIYSKSGNGKSMEELREAMKRAIAEAEQIQKMRGTMPVGLQRLVDNILRPKIPWKTLLRQALKEGLGRTTTQSWKKLSRRHRDYPGNKRLTTPTVWVGVDTSGSIGEHELRQFLGEIYGIAKQARANITVIPWDAQMYEPIKLTSASRIHEVAKKLKGGGGTNPTEFMKYVRDHMRNLDAVVILSDGYIGYPGDYKRLAKEIKAKSSVSIFVTTGTDVRWPGWKAIRLD